MKNARRLAFEADRARKQAQPIRVMRVRWSRSKYRPRLNVPKAQRAVLKRLIDQYGLG